jgi:lysophospholipase L1-like esterase
VASLALLEVALYFALAPTLYQHDSLLGWRTKSNFEHTFTGHSQDGTAYSVTVKTNSAGARTYQTGPQGAPPLSLLVIGDSFSIDANASDDQMWYSYLSRAISEHSGRSVSVTAIGGGAYGTLQQLILAQQLTRQWAAENDGQERPFDLIILQACFNDLTDNSLPLSKEFAPTTNVLRRPYLITDNISFPVKRSDLVYERSLFARFLQTFSGRLMIETVVERLYSKWLLSSLQKRMPSLSAQTYTLSLVEQNAAGAADHAFQITKLLTTRLRSLFPQSQAFWVQCADLPPDIEHRWANLATEAGFTVLPSAPHAVQAARDERKVVHTLDGIHLNPLGNQIFGQALFKDLQRAQF